MKGGAAVDQREGPISQSPLSFTEDLMSFPACQSLFQVPLSSLIFTETL